MNDLGESEVERGSGPQSTPTLWAMSNSFFNSSSQFHGSALDHRSAQKFLKELLSHRLSQRSQARLFQAVHETPLRSPHRPPPMPCLLSLNGYRQASGSDPARVLRSHTLKRSLSLVSQGAAPLQAGLRSNTLESEEVFQALVSVVNHPYPLTL